MSNAMTALDAIIEVKNVSKSFGTHRVLQDVSLAVSPGEVIAIIGPSGAGKSTLLRAINGLAPIDSGSIRVGETSFPRYDRRNRPKAPPEKALAQVRRHAGMIFQNFNLFPHMTVVENVMVAPRKALRRNRADSRARAEELLVRLGLGDKLDKYPRQLSGGQQQRVAIARALAVDPHVLLCDEVTSALDPELVGEVLIALRELASEGMTMIVVTHEMHFAQDVADRVVVMADGELIEEGPPTQIFQRPTHLRTKQFLHRLLERETLTQSNEAVDE